MPIYIYSCDACGELEKLMPLSLSDLPYIQCDCGSVAERIPARFSSHADPNWHFGEFVRGHGYLNSKAQIERAHTKNGTRFLHGRGDFESSRRECDRARLDKESKVMEESRKSFEEVITGSGVINSFGEVRPEALKPLSSEPITSTSDPRLAAK